MKNYNFNLEYVYVYVLLKNVGYYMEPDVELVRVFANLEKCKHYMSLHPLSCGHYFIEKRRLYLC